MSDSPQTTTETRALAGQLAGRWQVPLFIVALVMLAIGVWRLIPGAGPPSFEELYGRAKALSDGGFYSEASDYTEGLLADPARSDPERRRLHGLLAQIIFAHESNNAVHGEGNTRRILTHSDQSLGEGESHDGETLRMRGQACEWLRHPARALVEYRAAVAAGVEEIWEVRKRIVELQRHVGATAEELHQAYDALLSSERVDDALRYWAAEQKVELFAREGEHEEAERFLTTHAAAFQASAFRGQYDYLQAVVWHDLGQVERAETALRALRDQLSVSDPLYASSGWLLGKILQAQEAPEFALSFYDEVIKRTAPGPHRTACFLGMAEVLAQVERFDESIAAYHQAIRETTGNPYGGKVNLREIRESTTARYRALAEKGRLPEAMGYLRIAAQLAPPADADKQALYASWLADLSFKLGEKALERATDNPSEDAGQEARTHFMESGQTYLRLAKLISLDEQRSSSAIWRAADAFDRASEWRWSAEVLEKFIQERPSSNRIPEALHRLGQTYHALGAYDKAILRYEETLERFPELPWAVKSVVPLAECFIETDQPDQAEQALLRIVPLKNGRLLPVVTPDAREYRESLFHLGDLYIESRKFEEAIACYEEVLERYGDDLRSDRATFILADAYRQSATRIYEEDLNDPSKVAYRDEYTSTYLERLDKAKSLYDRVIGRFSHRPQATLSELDQLYLKLSHFYRADVVFDRARVLDASDLDPYVRSLELYDKAALEYQHDPMAMTAYVQRIRCYVRMGRIDKARMTLQRAKWALDRIDDDAFLRYSPREDRAYWKSYLAWLERTPTLAITQDMLTDRG